jgi:hypothetical protein
MSISDYCRSAMAILALAGCATPGPGTPPGGVDHVVASPGGLKVFFGKDVNWTPSNGFRAGGLTVSRAGEHGSIRYAVVNGRSEDKDERIVGNYLLMKVGDSAGTFTGFGACSYDLKRGEHGPYLDVNGAEGDLSDATYSARFDGGNCRRSYSC